MGSFPGVPASSHKCEKVSSDSFPITLHEILHVTGGFSVHSHTASSFVVVFSSGMAVCCFDNMLVVLTFSFSHLFVAFQVIRVPAGVFRCLRTFMLVPDFMFLWSLFILCLLTIDFIALFTITNLFIIFFFSALVIDLITLRLLGLSSHLFKPSYPSTLLGGCGSWVIAWPGWAPVALVSFLIVYPSNLKIDYPTMSINIIYVSLYM